MSIPKTDDKTRFAMADYEFDCGMPACVAGHAKHVFNWGDMDETYYYDKFLMFFGLNDEETIWITDTGSYKSRNPTPETAAKHIQDILDGKFSLNP